MQPARSAPPSSQSLPPAAAELIHHLAHELRQPLSAIESEAYYIDMVAGEARPDLIPHCRRLRAMVQHANWLVDDVTLCLALPAAARALLPVAEAFRRAARRLYEQEEAVLDLHVEAEERVEAPETLFQLVEHMVAFLRNVAGCGDPMHAAVRREGLRVEAQLWADGCKDAEDAARALRSAAACGALGRFMEAARGTFEVVADASAGRLGLTLRLPAGEQGQ